MARGFLAGILWGGVTGAVILGVSSQVAERRVLSLPKPQASAVEVPAGSEFDQARAESDPVVPEIETRPSGEEVSGVVVPPDDTTDTPPNFDTSSLEVPQPSTDGPDSLGDVPSVADAVDIAVTGPASNTESTGRDVAVLDAPTVPANAPETTSAAPVGGVQPVTDADQSVLAAPSTTAPAQGAAPDTAESVTPDAPSSASTQSASAPETTTEPTQVSPLQTETSPIGIASSGDAGGAGPNGSFLVPVQEIGNLAPDVTTDRLPSIGNPVAVRDSDASLPTIRRPEPQQPAVEPESSGDTSVADANKAPSPDASIVGALQAYKLAFSTTSDLPLMAVVLVHQADALPDVSDLNNLPETVAFAVNAGYSQASEISAAYRATGREVVMIPSLPAGATPQDVEVALQINFETIPEAVAVMDSSGGGFQSDRSAVAQIVDVVGDTGHGLITFPRGLNTARQRAEREGIPNALIFRDIDGRGEDGAAIRRAMDRAAFRARQNEAVVLVGRATAVTKEAILEWSLGSRAASVTLAPISAALLNER